MTDDAIVAAPIPGIAWACASVAFAIVSISYCWIVVTGAAMPDGSGGIYGMDFRDTVWLPLRYFFSGNVPWNVDTYLRLHPFAQFFPLYLPSYWLPSALFLLIPYRACLVVWTTGSSVLLTLVTLAAFRRVAPSLLRRLPWAPAALILLMAFTRPGRAGLTAANWALPGACAAAYLLVAVGQSRSRVVAAMVSFVKPQLGLAMGFQLALAKRFALLVRAVVASAILLLVPMLLVLVREHGIGGLISDVRATLALGDGPDAGPETVASTRVDAVGLLGHLMIDTPGIVDVLLMVLVASLTYGVWLVATRRFGPYHTAALLSAGLALCIILPNQIYAVPTILPGIVALWRDTVLSRGRTRAMALLGQALLAPAFFLSGPVPGWLGLTPQQAAFLAGLALHAAAVWCGLSVMMQAVTRPVVELTTDAGPAR